MIVLNNSSLCSFPQPGHPIAGVFKYCFCDLRWWANQMAWLQSFEAKSKSKARHTPATTRSQTSSWQGDAVQPEEVEQEEQWQPEEAQSEQWQPEEVEQEVEEVQQPWQAVAQQALQRLQQQGLMPVQPPGAGGGEAGAGSELQAQEDMEMMQETLHHDPEQMGQMVDEAIHQAQQGLQQAQETLEEQQTWQVQAPEQVLEMVDEAIIHQDQQGLQQAQEALEEQEAQQVKPSEQELEEVDEAIHQAQQNLQQAQEAVEVEEEDQQTSNSSDEGVSLLETTPTL